MLHRGDVDLRSTWPSHADPAKGLRAACLAGPAAFPYGSVRELTAPRSGFFLRLAGNYRTAAYAPKGPSASWNDEVQGVLVGPDGYGYLTTTDAIWCWQYREDAEPRVGDFAKVETSGYSYLGVQHVAGEAASDISDPGFLGLGAELEHDVGPVHMGPPVWHQDRILIPAEGNAEPRRPGSTRQIVWVIDPITLGLIGSIFLPELSENRFPWLATHGNLLYAPFGRDKLRIYRIPDMASFDEPPLQLPARQYMIRRKRITAEHVGDLSIVDGDKIADVETTGGTFLGGVLFIATKDSRGDDAEGIAVVNPLTGFMEHWQSYRSGAYYGGGSNEIEGLSPLGEHALLLTFLENRVVGSRRYSVIRIEIEHLSTTVRSVDP